MGKDIVMLPMRMHEEGFHVGHHTLFDYAEQIGQPEVLVLPNPMYFTSYMQGRYEEIRVPQALKRMDKEVANRGLKMNIMDYPSLTREQRTDLWNRTHKFVDVYGDIIPESAKAKCAMSLMFSFHPAKVRGAPKERWNYVVRGPTLEGFFLKKVGRLFGFSEVIIMPTIVKDPMYGVTAQGTLSVLTAQQKESIKRIPYMLGGIRPKMQIGDNPSLVKEVNLSYTHRPWKLVSLIVVEGGIVPGRLEVATFNVLDQIGVHGTYTLEDITYYV